MVRWSEHVSWRSLCSLLGPRCAWASPWNLKEGFQVDSNQTKTKQKKRHSFEPDQGKESLQNSQNIKYRNQEAGKSSSPLSRWHSWWFVTWVWMKGRCWIHCGENESLGWEDQSPSPSPKSAPWLRYSIIPWPDWWLCFSELQCLHSKKNSGLTDASNGNHASRTPHEPQADQPASQPRLPGAPPAYATEHREPWPRKEGPPPKAVPGSDGEGESGISGDSGPAGSGKRCPRRLVFTPLCAGCRLPRGTPACFGGWEPSPCISFPKLSGDQVCTCLWRCRGFYLSQSALRILMQSIIVGKWLFKLQVFLQKSPWGFPVSFQGHCVPLVGVGQPARRRRGCRVRGATDTVLCLHPWAQCPCSLLLHPVVLNPHWTSLQGLYNRGLSVPWCSVPTCSPFWAGITRFETFIFLTLSLTPKECLGLCLE